MADLASSAGAAPVLDEDAKALSLLSEVVSKLQGLVVASRSPQSARAKLPVPPPRSKPKHKPGAHTETHTAMTHHPRQGKDHKEHKEHKDHKDHKDHKEHKEHKEHKDHKDHKEIKEHKEQGP